MANKKLYKSTNKMICGVCGGIADYFGCDPTIVRLAVVALTFFTACVGIIPYLIAAVIIPNEPTKLND